MEKEDQMQQQMPETPVDGMGDMAAQAPVTPSSPFYERVKKAYPDREFASDDDVNGALNERMDYLESYENDTKNLHSKLDMVLKSEPVIGSIIKDVSKGATFMEALSRNVDIDELKPIEGDPDYDAWTKNLEERNAAMAEREAKAKEMQDNFDMSMAEISAFAEENGMTEQDAKKFISSVDELVGEIVAGRITKSTLSRMKKALDYDMDVQSAMQAGEVKGRNEKIEVKRASESKRGDGLPAITSSGTLGDKPKPTVKTDDWSKAVEEAKKREKLK